MSRTKVIATYGPACESEKILSAMLREGLDVLRLNLSHLAPEKLAETVARVRKIAAQTGMPIAILADMPGPKIRCTPCEPEKFEVQDEDRIEIAPGKALSTPRRIYIPYPHLLDDVLPGHEVAINDGLVLIRVEKVDRQVGALRCRVIHGGEIASRKGVCFLHSTLRISGITPRDRQGLRAAAACAVDFVALSFVRNGKDVEAGRRILRAAGAPTLPIIAKIEQHEAIDHLEDILDACDGVMVARGDMGIELPLEQVPLLQKDIILRSNQKGRFVITATQMLESMTYHSRPTRAEVSDVANAILDGSDAVMLSGETAAGKHPVRAVKTMTGVALAAESRISHVDVLERLRPFSCQPNDPPPELDEALAFAACQLALGARLDAIVCISFYGTTARRIARYRAACPIHVLSPYEDQCRRLALTWGVEVFPFPEAHPDRSRKNGMHPGALIDPALSLLRTAHRLKKGQRIAILAGVPLDAPGGTNYLRVVEVP